jgi:hypothetical protein
MPSNENAAEQPAADEAAGAASRDAARTAGDLATTTSKQDRPATRLSLQELVRGIVPPNDPAYRYAAVVSVNARCRHREPATPVEPTLADI